MFSLMFLLSILMRLVVGYLGDRIPLQPMMAIQQGSNSLNWVALGNFFCRTSFASLMGIISTAFNLGMLVSPIYAGVSLRSDR